MEASFIGRINEATAHMAAARPDLLVCVGGDGFIAYAADWLIRNHVSIPLLGLAGGTANVGPLIRFAEHNIERLTPSGLKYDRVGAVEVSVEGHILGYAFNDLIIGDTFLTSLEGKMVNISAADFLNDGSKHKVSPSTEIIGKNFRLHKNGRAVSLRMNNIAQIVVSPLHKKEYYRGKAIAGALCFSYYTNDCAAVGISDRILVDSSSDGLEDQTVSIEHLLFKEGDSIEMSGFTDKGCIIIDGNPFYHTEGTLALQYIDGIVTCAYAE
jgi:hypothetical protein